MVWMFLLLGLVSGQAMELEQIRLSVWEIRTPMGAGCAVVIDDSGLALASYHVIQANKTVEAIRDGRTVQAEVLFGDSGDDLSVLRLAPGPALSWAARVAVGEPAWVVGAPFTRPLGKPHGSVVRLGVDGMSAFGSTPYGWMFNQNTYVRLTAVIHDGESGGAVINGSGQLIGIAAASNGKDYYALDLAHVKRFLKKFQRCRDPKQSRAGCPL